MKTTATQKETLKKFIIVRFLNLVKGNVSESTRIIGLARSYLCIVRIGHLDPFQNHAYYYGKQLKKDIEK
jgi:hypothetical protein